MLRSTRAYISIGYALWVASPRRVSAWQEELSTHKKVAEIDLTTVTPVYRSKDEPFGQVAAHPRLVHVSQGTYKKDNQPTTPLKTPHSSQTTVARAFRSHLNLSLARLEQESSRADVVRTVGIPRRIRGHDPASAAVLVVGRCPWRSRSLAWRSVGVSNTLRKVEKKR